MKKLNSKGFVLTRSWIIAICVVAIVAAIAIPTAVYLANKEKPEPTEPTTTAQPQPTEPQPTEPQPTEPQPTEPQPTEPQPTEPQPTEPQPTPHTHSYELVESNSYAATCENSGLEYYECSCGEVIRQTIAALGHDYSACLITETTHTVKCSRCEATQGDAEIHTISLETFRCACGYTVPEKEQVAYKLAVELNGKLTAKCPTMYNTFNTLKGEGTIADVIAAIEKAEGDTGAMILWDQNSGKFVVAKEAAGNTYVLYAADEMSATVISLTSAKRQLWNVYDDENQIPKRENQTYSVYWNGTKMPAIMEGAGEVQLQVGFDMGTWTPDSRLVISSVAADANGPIVIIRTNLHENRTEVLADTVNSKINLGGLAPVHHYGEFMQVDFITYDGCEYYEHGTVYAVRFRGFEGKTYVFYTLKDGNTFEELGIANINDSDLSKITIKHFTDEHDHEYTVEGRDALSHWMQCVVCGEKTNVEAHSINTDTYACSCGYTIPEAEKTVYDKVLELNEMLTGKARIAVKYNTMYEVFNAVKGEGTIADVIAAIEKAEGDTGAMILWDQNSGKFVVAKEAAGNTYVLYAVDEMSGTTISLTSAKRQLWDVYDDENQIPKREDQTYSVYWNGTKMPAIMEGNGEVQLQVGFDMGTWTPDSRLVISSVAADANGPIVIIRTNIDKSRAEVKEDVVNSKINLGGMAPVHHYGEFVQVDFITYDGCEYYEHGTVYAVRFRGFEGKTYVFYTLEEGKTFEELGIVNVNDSDLSKITIKQFTEE